MSSKWIDRSLQTDARAKPVRPNGGAASGAFSESVAEATSRRGFLARIGRLVLAISGGGVVAAALRAQKADAYHFCGHIYTTGSCPHPTGLPRIDRFGFPLRALDGKPVPPAPRTRVCEAAAREFHFRWHTDGAWYRCCGGHVRKLVDCCGYVRNRINGDGALTGYCYAGRKVFCVTYYDPRTPC